MAIIIATLIALAVIASVLAQDFSIFSWAYWQEGGTSTSRSEVVRNLGLLAAGAIGLGFGIWRAYTAYRQTQAIQRQAKAANEQARLWDANLTGADLGDTNVTQEQLDSAGIIEGGKLPTLPEGLKPPQKECVPMVLIH